MRRRRTAEKDKLRRIDSREAITGVPTPGSPFTKPSLWARRRKRRLAKKQLRAQRRTGRGWSR